MTKKDELLEVQNELARTRQALTNATNKSEYRKQNELAHEIAALQAREAALIPMAEQEAAEAAAWQARESTPQAKQELKRITELSAEIDREALKLFQELGAVTKAGINLFEKIETLKDLTAKHSREKNAGAMVMYGENIQAASYLMQQLRRFRDSIWPRQDLAKYFPAE